jgi:hypothetical protein
MDKSVKELLEEASFLMGKVKLALYKAEEQAANDRKNELNQIWWSVDDLHKQVSKLI